MDLITNDDLVKALRLNPNSSQKLTNVIFKLLKLHEINSLYSASASDSVALFIENLFREIQINIEIDEDDLANIPSSGKLITVSNHPFGALDGLILMHLLVKKRPDVKIFANEVLERISPLKDIIIPIETFDKKEKRGNSSALIKATKHLASGGAISLFPSGEVSSLKSINTVEDREWNNKTIKFIQNSNASVVPIYFHGSNSLSFHLLGLIDLKLRSLKLPSELTNKKKKTISVRIGKAITVQEQQNFDNATDFGKFLRARTYALGNSLDVNRFFSMNLEFFKVKHPIIDQIHPLVIQNELEQLPENALLFNHGNYKIYCAGVEQIPQTILEIGRLREKTFRSAGEGTNKPLDIDSFDLNYQQLFIWDEYKQKVVGGYRVGLGADLFKAYKKKGFYLNTLFKFDKEFTPILKQSIELGRCFIAKEYQKRPFPLFLLWKGILTLLMNNKEYRYVIGPVSISNEYSDLSKNIIIDYLSSHHYDFKLSEWVKARKAFKIKYQDADQASIIQSTESLKLLDELIEDLEQRKQKLPILLKKYLDQNAKLLAFNRDPKFNNAVDGLMLLDVFDIPYKTLSNLSKNEETKKNVMNRFYSKYHEDLINLNQPEL